GGGLGMSVRQHRYWNRHKEDGSRAFAFIDGDSDGAARIYLPRGAFHSGDWTSPARPGDMLAYRIADHLPPVDLVGTLLAATAVHGDGCVDPPVDLVLLKIADNGILISTADRGQAVIDRQPDPAGRWVYRYRVVTDVKPCGDGGIDFAEVADPGIDPLGILQRVPAAALEHYYDEQTWLEITVGTAYPDSVVALTRHMLWQPNLCEREREFAPDLVVTARPGWYFGVEPTCGTTHGYPLDDAMRATLYVAGPGIRRGARVERPCRLVDLTPTLLEMTCTPYNPSEFDGRPLLELYESCDGSTCTPHPVYWHDVDLAAWSGLCYRPLEIYPHQPVSINKPSSFFDLNSLGRNAATVSELNVLRVFDDVLFPLSDGRRGLLAHVERTDLRVRGSRRPWLAELPAVLDASGVTLSDYDITSLGNLQRIDGAVDWMQNRTASLECRLLGTRLPASRLAGCGVDAAQDAIWDVYRLGQRIGLKLLDEGLLSGTEDAVDGALNRLRRTPAEVTADRHRPLR
ncbi:MAG: hypothetical protein KY476_11500, partial [Planctomycetes bacterium]|nr:hypothetical protein [Planctomycetota bacterium]